MGKIKKVHILVFVVFLVVAGLFFLRAARTSSAEKAILSESSNTYTVKRTSLKETLSISGVIDATERVRLQFLTGGKLAWVGVKEGDEVKKYQGIASLDVRDVEKKLQSSLNSFLNSRLDFDQTVQDNKEAQYKDGDLGDKMKRLIDKSQNSLNNAVITVELQSLAKEYSYLYSPIAGIVTQVDTPYAGVNAKVTDVFEVVNPETLYFSASADQTEVPFLAKGKKATMKLDAFPDELIDVTVEDVGFTPRVGDTGTSYEVKLQFEMPQNVLQKYRLGMTGDVEFVLKDVPEVLAVPISFVRSEGGKKVVYVKNGNKVEKTTITTSQEGDELIEVTSGLKEGDEIIEVTK